MRVRKLTSRYARTQLDEGSQVIQVSGTEMEVGQDFGPTRAVMDSAEVDLLAVERPTVGQREHRRDVPSEKDGALPRGPPLLQRATSLSHRPEERVRPAGAETVEILLPLAFRQRIVDHEVPVRPEVVVPPDHDLPVDEALVDPEEDDRHA